MRVALYARVSTERQAERGTIGSQLEQLRSHVAGAGHELVGEYVDDGHSGARLDRPGLDALRDAAEGGLFEQVWCLSPDRLARAYAYQVLVLDELARLGVTVRFTDAPDLPADDPQAVLLTQVQGVIAELRRPRSPNGTDVASCSGPAPERSPRGGPPTATDGCRAARPQGRRTGRSTSRKQPWCAASSTIVPAG